MFDFLFQCPSVPPSINSHFLKIVGAKSIQQKMARIGLLLANFIETEYHIIIIDCTLKSLTHQSPLIKPHFQELLTLRTLSSALAGEEKESRTWGEPLLFFQPSKVDEAIALMKESKCQCQERGLLPFARGSRNSRKRGPDLSVFKTS